MKIKFFLSLFLLLNLASLASAQLYVVASKSNDIVKVLDRNKIKYKLFASANAALDQAKRENGILILADNYPVIRTNLTSEVYSLIEKKKLKVYAEFPSTNVFPNSKSAKAFHKITLERAVVSTSAIKGLDSLSILGLNGMELIKSDKIEKTYLTVAKVAGFDIAEYGYSDVRSYPLLFKHNNVLIATTKLSNALTGRFGPAKSWQVVWQFILNDISGNQQNEIKKWPTEVAPTYASDQKLDKDALAKSVTKGINWYKNGRFLIDTSWLDLAKRADHEKNVVFPAVPQSLKAGDGSLGVIEGHYSKIASDGTQDYRWWLRADCQAETAFAFASAGKFFNNASYQQTAKNLLQYLYQTSNLTRKVADKKNDPSRGLIGWATTNADVSYGDDNARVILATLGAKTNLNTNQWDEELVAAILGNFRTSGKYGFRGGYLRDTTIAKIGIENFKKIEKINIHPHYESWLWATYLWLYDVTKHEPLLAKAKIAITKTMEAYPKWKWTNGIQQERARMILPLAWLVRVEDTPQHRAWLYTVSNKLLENLDEVGAIREELGTAGSGRYDKIRANKDYGLHEAPLIANNGDKVADMLYTTNFAFFTLNEAAHVLNDPKMKEEVDKIANFLIKIQVKSAAHPNLDGAWFRAFDYGRWDYWASNADSGWGPWGTLTGWTQSWIINTLLMVEQNTSLWEQARSVNNDTEFKATAQQLINEMLQ